MRPAGQFGGTRAKHRAPRPFAPLPPDERAVAAALLLSAGNRLTEVERSICVAATRPGAAPLDWRSKLRLAVAAGRFFGRAAP
jgi:hypothetical protein